MATSPNFMTRATRKPCRFPVPGQRRAGGQAATAAFAVATAVIGAGAAMLPTGAAAGASARILRSLPDQDTVADDQRSAASGDPGNGQVRSGSAASIGHAGPPPPRGQ
jgi:hypothetical protein